MSNNESERLEVVRAQIEALREAQAETPAKAEADKNTYFIQCDFSLLGTYKAMVSSDDVPNEESVPVPDETNKVFEDASAKLMRISLLTALKTVVTFTDVPNSRQSWLVLWPI